MIKKSFTLRVLVVSFLLLALPLLIDSFIFFQKSYNEAIQDAKNELESEVNFRVSTLSSVQPVRQVLLRELIFIMDLEKGLEKQDPKKMSHLLSDAVHEGGEFRLMILKKESLGKYKIIASSDPALIDTYFVSYRRLEALLKKGEGSLIRYLYSPDMKRMVPFLYLVRTIRSPTSGEMIGAMMVVSNVEDQIDTLIKHRESGRKMDFAILNPDGIVFDSYDPKLLGHYFDPISQERKEEIIDSGQIPRWLLSAHPLAVIKKEEGPFFEFIFNDQLQIAYRSPLQIGGISVMSYSAKEVFFGSALRHFLMIYTLYGLILVVGGGVTYWLALWISRPLRQLTEKMEEVSHGNLNVRFHEQRFGFEINILGQMFNQMLDDLFEKMEKTENETVAREKYQRELAITRSVQQTLFPQELPKFEGGEFAAIYLPAPEVGGDFYDFLKKQYPQGEGILITIADAVGMGIAACLYSFSIRSLLKSYAALYDDVGTILTRCNDAFIEDVGESGTFITLFYSIYHPQDQILDYCCCGHVPGLLKRKGEELVTINSSQIALGLKEKEIYKTQRIQLQQGDILLFCTDGLLEAKDENGAPFSQARVNQILNEREWSSAAELVDQIKASVLQYTQNKIQEEEIIIVALKIE